MYLPSFSRVGPRISRGASRSSRTVLENRIGAREKSAWRARSPRGSAGAIHWPCTAGATRTRRLPGGSREREIVFHPNPIKGPACIARIPSILLFLAKGPRGSAEKQEIPRAHLRGLYLFCDENDENVRNTFFRSCAPKSEKV